MLAFETELTEAGTHHFQDSRHDLIDWEVYKEQGESVRAHLSAAGTISVLDVELLA